MRLKGGSVAQVLEGQMDRRDVQERFRIRLLEVMDQQGLSRSALAREIGLDRSTLSQILHPDADRLPRAETLAAIGSRFQVSVDWLLGLSEEGNLGPEALAEQIQVEHNAQSPSDQRLAAWHREAVGYKIRYVPATLPDLLRTEAVIRYELEAFATSTPEAGIELSADRLELQRRPETDMECCMSADALAGFVRGEGIWRNLTLEARREQVDQMIGLLDELYPTFRLFLFDGLELYASPVTIFGPKRAAMYLGQLYLVVTSTDLIRTLTQQGCFRSTNRGLGEAQAMAGRLPLMSMN